MQKNYAKVRKNFQYIKDFEQLKVIVKLLRRLTEATTQQMRIEILMSELKWLSNIPLLFALPLRNCVLLLFPHSNLEMCHTCFNLVPRVPFYSFPPAAE